MLTILLTKIVAQTLIKKQNTKYVKPRNRIWTSYNITPAKCLKWLKAKIFSKRWISKFLFDNKKCK